MMETKAKHLVAVVLGAILGAGLLVSVTMAHSIDYLATDIQPEALFTGQSGHFQLKDPIAPGATITFNLTLELIESVGGGTSALPATVTFGVKNTGGPEAPLVKFGAPGTTLTDTVVHRYDKVNNRIVALMTPVTAYAPATPGSYHFKIQALDGFKGNWFTPGDGIVVHFKVAGDTTPIPTKLILDVPSAFYRAPTNDARATLINANTGVGIPGQAIRFFVDGIEEATVTTDGNGAATLAFDPSTLSVGDYPVAANFDAAGGYAASSGSSTQCVTYRFLGYQPPVLVQETATSGLGIGLFQGKVIPVKVKIADYYGAPVANAQARVYFSQTMVGAAEVQAVAIQPTIADDGSLMRYDGSSDQYILNWNIARIPNGDYNIRIGMEEGECAVAHWSPVRLGKATR